MRPEGLNREGFMYTVYINIFSEVVWIHYLDQGHVDEGDWDRTNHFWLVDNPLFPLSHNSEKRKRRKDSPAEFMFTCEEDSPSTVTCQSLKTESRV